MRERSTWYSQRLERDVTVVRWGTFGMPVLIFPTAGGDAEEIERFQIIETLRDPLEAGKVKVYSCDSVAGRALLAEEGSPEHRMWIMNQFQEFVRQELVPAIWTDCRTEGIGIAVAGASIGAFHALASMCRYPDAFTKALCMSGTYDLQRFVHAPLNQDFWFASPVHWLTDFHDEGHLAALRERFVVLACGEGRAEDIGESWRAARVLGDKGVPNRVDNWGPQWDHDWPTWRRMLRVYLHELVEGA